MITASSDVTEMARTFCGGSLGTGEQSRGRRVSAAWLKYMTSEVVLMISTCQKSLLIAVAKKT